ncbi:MAG TPA: alpha/beta hydrolase [Candidatus Limnocylindria bacterium]|nr:alpha/beta hydrolase [Candidatus Limnocylindria bacterium]
MPIVDRGSTIGDAAAMVVPTMNLRLQDGRSLDVFLDGPETGTPLVYHVGSPAAGLPFAPTVEVLAERGLRYVSFSRPGYGSSTRRAGRSVADVVEDTEAVLDAIGGARCYVIGWSGGGPHALACAARMRTRVISAATIGGVAPYPAEGLDWTRGMGAENVEEFGAALAGPDQLIDFKERAAPVWRAVTPDDVADAFGDLVDDVDRGSLTGEFAVWMADVFHEALRVGYWGWFDDDMAFAKPWGFELDEIHVPVFVWQGGHDRMVPFAHGEWLAAHIPGARPRLFPEEGHLSLAVDSFARIVDELLTVSR